LGIPPGSFASSTVGQASPSASVPMANQQHVSASQLITQSMSATQPMGQNMASTSQSTPQQQIVTTPYPVTPTEVLISKLPYLGGVNWVFHDPTIGTVRHVNVPYVHSIA
jgi:hypothetical protein